jgi:hypothetical protein
MLMAVGHMQILIISHPQMVLKASLITLWCQLHFATARCLAYFLFIWSFSLWMMATLFCIIILQVNKCINGTWVFPRGPKRMLGLLKGCARLLATELLD